MASGDLTRRLAYHKILHDKALNIAKNPKYDGYQRDVALMIYKEFDKKKTSATQANKSAAHGNKDENISNIE